MTRILLGLAVILAVGAPNVSAAAPRDTLTNESMSHVAFDVSVPD